MVNSKHLSNKSESTSTLALKTRKASTIGNDCIPSTSRTNDEASFVEVIKNVIKKSSRETHLRCHQKSCEGRTSES